MRGRSWLWVAVAVACMAIAPTAGADGGATANSSGFRIVEGKGFAIAAGRVRLSARGDVNRGSGKVRVRDYPVFSSATGESTRVDFKGRVTCVSPFPTADPGSNQVNVGGTLRRPLVHEGKTYTRFLFQLFDTDDLGGTDFARTIVFEEFWWNLLDADDCGAQWWADAFWQAVLFDPDADPAVVRVSRGDFTIKLPRSRHDHDRDDDDDDDDDDEEDDD